MSKLTEEYLETTMEDENGGEIDIRVHYDYQRFERPEYDRDGNCNYGGCFSSVTVDFVEERTLTSLDTWEWLGYFDYEESQAQDWKEEIATLINAKENDDEHN